MKSTIIPFLLVIACCVAQRRPHGFFRPPQEFPEENKNNNQPQEFHQDERLRNQQPPREHHISSTTAEPLEDRRQFGTPIPIISLSKEQSIDGSYKTSYETGNHIIAEETGFLKNVGVKDEEALVQHGSYSYTDPDGNIITVTYTADEGGFRPQGAHLPTPPPVPVEVQKGLDIIFEQIRLQAEKEAKEKQYENIKQESANYPSEPSPDNRRFRP